MTIKHSVIAMIIALAAVLALAPHGENDKGNQQIAELKTYLASPLPAPAAHSAFQDSHEMYALMLAGHFASVDRTLSQIWNDKRISGNGFDYASTLISIITIRGGKNMAQLAAAYAKAFPRSVFAQSFVAEAYYNYAFDGRGRRWNSETNDERFRIFAGRIEVAQMAAETALTIDPSYYPALTTLIKISRADGKPEQAQDYFQKAKKIAPFDIDAHQEMLETLLSKWGGSDHKYDEFAKTTIGVPALSAVESHALAVQMQRRDMTNVMTLQARGAHLIELYHAQLTRFPYGVKYMQAYTHTLLNMNECQFAHDLIDRAIKIEPARADLYYTRARTDICLQDTASALSDYMSYAEIDDNNIKNLSTAARFAITGGNRLGPDLLARARNVMQKGAQLDPSDDGTASVINCLTRFAFSDGPTNLGDLCEEAQRQDPYDNDIKKVLELLRTTRKA